MADYSEEIQDAVEMIEEAGGPFTFQRHTPDIPDADKPWRTTEVAPVEFTVTAAMFEYKVSQQSAGFTAGSEDSTGVLPGDMIVYLAAGSAGISFVPRARDSVIAPNGLGTFGVVDNITVAPNGDAILYKLWVRK